MYLTYLGTNITIMNIHSPWSLKAGHIVLTTYPAFSAPWLEYSQLAGNYILIIKCIQNSYT